MTFSSSPGLRCSVPGLPSAWMVSLSFMILGSSLPLTAWAAVTRVILRGEFATNFGQAVSSAGDFNADGLVDFVVGAPGTDNGRGGTAYIHFGDATLDTDVDLTLTGYLPSGQFGYSVASAGDVNSDGYDDLIVGAPSSTDTFQSDGRAYVFFGGVSPDSASDLILVGDQLGAYLGNAVGSAGDFNGDGHDDLIVGAMLHDARGPDTGRAYVYWGGPLFDALPDVTLTGEAQFQQFGIAVGSVGDMNGDGFDDVVIGADRYSNAQTFVGRAYVYFGRPLAGSGHQPVPDLIMTGQEEREFFGSSLGGVGDVNGDGYDDFVVGAPERNVFEPVVEANGDGNGEAYLYWGGANPDNVPDLILTGAGGYNWMFGVTTGSAGDYNADGRGDVFVGATGTCCQTGLVHVYFGGPSMDGLADDVLAGTIESGEFGQGAAAVGDLNADGADEIIVGESFQNLAHLFVSSHPTPTIVSGLWVEASANIVTLHWRVHEAPIREFRIHRNEIGDQRILAAVLEANGPGKYEWTDAQATPGYEFEYHLELILEGGASFWEGPVVWNPSLGGSQLAWNRGTPNPFTDEVVLELSTPNLQATVLAVFDVTGQRVATLRSASNGPAQVSWNGRDAVGRVVPPGVYLVQAELEGRTAVRRVVKVR